MQRSIVWDCLNCGERNHTNHDAANPTCWKCKRVYSWQSMAFTAGVSHEETLDDDGNFDADAWMPDFADDEDIPDNPDLEGHVGFYATADDGTPFHVLGNPNMSDETLKALGELAKAAVQYVESKTLPDDDDWSPAPPEGYIALSDAEIEAAEAEDRDFQTCHQCGQLHEDCQCDE